QRQAALYAIDILTHSQQLARAVNRVVRNGCSENDIDFYSDGILPVGYQHAAPVDDKCKIFNNSGGAISWSAPDQNIVKATAGWVITAANAFPGMGEDDEADIVFLIRDVKSEIC